MLVNQQVGSEVVVAIGPQTSRSVGRVESAVLLARVVNLLSTPRLFLYHRLQQLFKHLLLLRNERLLPVLTRVLSSGYVLVEILNVASEIS